MIHFIEALILSFFRNQIKNLIYVLVNKTISLCYYSLPSIEENRQIENLKLKFLFVSHKNICGWLSTLLSSPRIGYTSFIPDFYELIGFTSFCQFWEYFSFSSSFLRYCPVYDFLTERISSGLPSKRRDPPLSPPSGPRSTM